MKSSSFEKELKILLPERSGFPGSMQLIAGRTLSKRRDWWKAILLVNAGPSYNTRPQLRLYAWQFNKKTGSWKQRQKFNFSGMKYIPDVISILESFMGKRPSASESGRIELMAKRLHDLEATLYREREDYSRSRIPEMDTKVREFESLLSAKKLNENEIQKFLHREYWMLGSRYRRIHREKWAGLKGRNDFILEKTTDFNDVLELKLPSEDLFVGGSRPRMSSALKDAISQMAQYLHYYRVHYLSHREQTNLDMLYPHGYIVIGRRKQSERETLEYHNAVLNRISVLTYDDVIDEAKQVIKTLKKRKKLRR